MIEKALLWLAEWALFGIFVVFATIWLIGVSGIAGVSWLWEKARG